MIMKFNIGDTVRVTNYPYTGYIGQVGTVVRSYGYVSVKFSDGTTQLLLEEELELVVTQNNDVTGKEIKVGDTIVYFTRSGSTLSSQKAKVEFIGKKHNTGPHIKVLREDAVEKDRFTRKAWLWSFQNSVKVN